MIAATEKTIDRKIQRLVLAKEKSERLIAANQALAVISETGSRGGDAYQSVLELGYKSRLFVRYGYADKMKRRQFRVQCVGSLYADLKGWAGGGTASQALSSLALWVQGKPCLPLSTFRMWAGKNYRLMPIEAVEALGAAGYPAKAHCIFCGCELKGFDWWKKTDRVAGPGCHHGRGCKG